MPTCSPKETLPSDDAEMCTPECELLWFSRPRLPPVFGNDERMLGVMFPVLNGPGEAVLYPGLQVLGNPTRVCPITPAGKSTSAETILKSRKIELGLLETRITMS